MQYKKEVAAIIVSFNSDIDTLNTILNRLSAQCNIIIIDNSELIFFRDQISLLANKYRANYYSLNQNMGIAYAQNYGIEMARALSASDVLLMDDDSIPPHDLVHKLIESRESFPDKRIVIGARAVTSDGRDISNCQQIGSENYTTCSEMMSSGTLIPIDLFNQVGHFDDSLFIDCVDFEWGWRARDLGVSLILHNKVSIQHKLGIGTSFGLKIPSPIRHYYQFRNVLRMIYFSSAPLKWRLIQSTKLPVKLILIALITENRISRIRYSLLGIVDFARNRKGKFNY